MTILDEIAKYTKKRTEIAKSKISLDEIKEKALLIKNPKTFPFEDALKKPEISFICECKKASPSKGIIVQDFPYVEIAKQYENAGADCISVLTEPKWFLGDDLYLKEIASTVEIPCLRKDFTIDEYMIYEAKLLGAKAVLLICSILTAEQIRQYIKICDTLNISALVEAHNEDEVKTAINCGARIIGVNNRNLKDFTVDTKICANLRRLVPDNILFVAESGVKTPQDIQILKGIGADGVLIGETLMKAEDKKSAVDRLKTLI